MESTIGLGMLNCDTLFGLCLNERQQRWSMLDAKRG